MTAKEQAEYFVKRYGYKTAKKVVEDIMDATCDGEMGESLFWTDVNSKLIELKKQ